MLARTIHDNNRGVGSEAYFLGKGEVFGQIREMQRS